MKKSLIIILFYFLFIHVYSAQIKGIVSKVIDGDTIYIVDGSDTHEKHGKFKIRFADIDSPELKQDYGKESAMFLSNLILNKKVIVRFNKIDVYGRIVGTVYLIKNELDKKQINVNDIMVDSGNAWFYQDYSKKIYLKQLQQKAKNNRVGLWKFDNFQPPWIYRKENKKNININLKNN